MPARRWSRAPHVLARLFLLVALAAAATACDDDRSTGPRLDPLAGLSEIQNDSGGETPPDTASDAPGQIVGIVKGWEIGPQGDTLEAPLPLAGVSVTAYERLGAGAEVRAGEKMAETTTNGNGRFELPPLPAGEYVVTFVPAAGSPYRAGWTVGHAWSGSHLNEWFIMLLKNAG